MPSLRHIVAAVAPDAAAASALRVARALADATNARLSLFSLADQAAPGAGIAGIEVPRFAESVRADLIVLPRMTVGGELLVDAVTRRSRVPSLAVSPGQEDLSTWLVALDGSPRCTGVLSMIAPLIDALGARATAVTVEPRPPAGKEPVSHNGYLARTVELARALDGGAGAFRGGHPVQAPLRVRHGDVIPEVLSEQRAVGAGVLVIGARPGGPPPPIPEGSLARRLVNDAPCMVLAVPL